MNANAIDSGINNNEIVKPDKNSLMICAEETAFTSPVPKIDVIVRIIGGIIGGIIGV